MTNTTNLHAPNHNRQTLWRATLFIVALIGLGLRLWGIRYGLPYMYHPDEPLVSNALHIFQTGDLNPHFFGYGSLFFYLNALAYIPYYTLGRLIGLFHTPSDIPQLHILNMGVGRSLMPSQIILGRLVSVATGVLTIGAAYWSGTRLSSRWVGLLAAILVAVSPPLVMHSQFITPNMLVTLLILLTLVALQNLTTQSPWSSYSLVGILWGSALASKYNAAIVVISCGAAYWMLHGWKTLWLRKVYLSLLLAGLAFVILTPYAVLDFPTFIKDTKFHVVYYATVSHPGMEGNTVEFYINYLVSQEGLLACLGMIQVVSYIMRRNTQGLILASFALPYMLYIFALRIRNDRTILLALPVLLIMAADLLYSAWQHAFKLSTRQMKRIAQVCLLIFSIGSVIHLGWLTVKQDITKTMPDGREYARQWIEMNVLAGTRIAAEIYSPFIDPARYDVTYLPYVIDHPAEWYVEQKYDLLVLSNGAYGRYYAKPDLYANQIAKYESFFEQFAAAAQFDQNAAVIRILKIER